MLPHCFSNFQPKLRGGPERHAEGVVCDRKPRQKKSVPLEYFPHPNGAGRLTASIGVADAIKGDKPEFLLRRAQNGLAIAKREGRNRVVEMTPDGPIWEMERRA